MGGVSRTISSARRLRKFNQDGPSKMPFFFYRLGKHIETALLALGRCAPGCADPSPCLKRQTTPVGQHLPMVHASMSQGGRAREVAQPAEIEQDAGQSVTEVVALPGVGSMSTLVMVQAGRSDVPSRARSVG